MTEETVNNLLNMLKALSIIVEDEKLDGAPLLFRAVVEAYYCGYKAGMETQQRRTPIWQD